MPLLVSLRDGGKREAGKPASAYSIMIQLCCTQRVQKHFAIPDEALHKPIRGNSTLGNWYLDVTSIDGQTCLLCMSERTLLSFLLVEDDTKANLGETFINGLLKLLQAEALSHEQFEAALKGCEEITVTGATNERALASLSSLADHYKWGIDGSGGYKRCDLPAITSGVNRMPQPEIGGGGAISMAKELISSASSQNWVS